MIGIVKSLIVAAALAHGVSTQTMLCTAFRESSFNPFAVNQSSGYVGLYQLSPDNQQDLIEWAKTQGVDGNPFDPSQQANWTAESFMKGYTYRWPRYQCDTYQFLLLRVRE